MNLNGAFNHLIKIILMGMFFNISIAQDPVDGIVVAVEDKIILKSDVILNMQLSGVQLSQNSIQLENIYNNFSLFDIIYICIFYKIINSKIS